MNKLLIVVDFQNDFVNGSLGFKKAELLENFIADKIDIYRANNDYVVFTYDTHKENYLETLEGKNLPIKHCIENSEGHKLYGKISKLKKNTDKVFLKNSFGSIELFDFLRNNSFYSIELVGLVSNICVIANAILAKTACPETEVIVDSNCTASYDEALNEKALDVLEGLQIKVLR